MVVMIKNKLYLNWHNHRLGDFNFQSGLNEYAQYYVN